MNADPLHRSELNLCHPCRQVSALPLSHRLNIVDESMTKRVGMQCKGLKNCLLNKKEVESRKSHFLISLSTVGRNLGVKVRINPPFIQNFDNRSIINL